MKKLCLAVLFLFLFAGLACKNAKVVEQLVEMTATPESGNEDPNAEDSSIVSQPNPQEETQEEVTIKPESSADSTPPDTFFSSGPEGLVEETSATFEFFATEEGTFLCQLNDKDPSICQSPITFNALEDGEHTLSVTAIDKAGNVDPSPALRSWAIPAPPWVGIKQFHSEGRDVIVDVAVDSLGSVYGAGSVGADWDAQDNQTFFGENDALLVKYDSSGRLKWVKHFGGSRSDSAYRVVIDREGFVYVTGQWAGGSEEKHDVFLAKYSPAGEQIWFQRYRFPANSRPRAMTLDDAGVIYIAGMTDGPMSAGPVDFLFQGLYDAFVMKVDAEMGEALDVFYFGSDQTDEVADMVFGRSQNGEASLYLVGRTNGDMDGEGPEQKIGYLDVFFLRMNMEGIVQWVRQLGSSYRDEGTAIAFSGDRIFVAGMIDTRKLGSQEVQWDSFLYVYDMEGHRIWGDVFAVSGIDSAAGLAVDSQGNIFMGGYVRGVLDGETFYGLIDGYVAKYVPREDGDYVRFWQRQFGSITEDRFYGLAVDLENNVFLVGQTAIRFEDGALLNQYYDGMIVKYNGEGVLQ